MAEPKTMVCTRELNQLGKTPQQARHPIKAFSKLQNGKRRSICKKCQAELSRAWTTRRADFRSLYQRALYLSKQGYDVRIPEATTYQSGDVIRTTKGRVFKLPAR